MSYSSRPPRGLRELGIKLLRGPLNNLSSIVWVVDLLSGLHQFDVCFGQNPAVDLLQALKGFLVVTSQEAVILNRQHRPLVAVDTDRDDGFV